MFICKARQKGFALVHSLIFLSLISLIVLRSLEFNLMQAQLIQAFYHSAQLLNKQKEFH